MARHNKTGNEGERLAQEYLLQQGYAILETNWRAGHLEADIIAYWEGVVVFVEVKTRQDDTYGAPETFVKRSKQLSYVKLANIYMLQNHRSEEVRFDIIAIEMHDGMPHINHLVDAYRAGRYG